VTAFLRSNRGVDSEVDDTYTVILQYEGEQKNLLVTIKTAIVTHMKDQVRFFIRGTGGTYLKVKALTTPPSPPTFGLFQLPSILAHLTLCPNSSATAPRKPTPSPPPANRPSPPTSVSKTRASGAP